MQVNSKDHKDIENATVHLQFDDNKENICSMKSS